MKKYRTSSYSYNLIKEVEVDRFSEMSVWIDGRRIARRTENHNYFDTWEEAHNYLIDRATDNVYTAQRELTRAEAELDKIKALNQEG
jgi:hypothetical protein